MTIACVLFDNLYYSTACGPQHFIVATKPLKSISTRSGRTTVGRRKGGGANGVGGKSVEEARGDATAVKLWAFVNEIMNTDQMLRYLNEVYLSSDAMSSTSYPKVRVGMPRDHSHTSLSLLHRDNSADDTDRSGSEIPVASAASYRGSRSMSAEGKQKSVVITSSRNRRSMIPRDPSYQSPQHSLWKIVKAYSSEVWRRSFIHPHNSLLLSTL